MTRPLDTATLDAAARDYAAAFLQRTQWSRDNPEVATFGKDWVIQNLYNADFKDEHEYLVPKVKAYLGPAALEEFEEANDGPGDDLDELLADDDKLSNTKGTLRIADSEDIDEDDAG